MKISELIRKNTENLINIMQEAEAESYRKTSCEYRVYIDSEGECGYEEWVAGDNGWFEFRDPDYHRYYIHTFCKQSGWRTDTCCSGAYVPDETCPAWTASVPPPAGTAHRL